MAEREGKIRLDELLVQRGLADGMDLARRLIMAGEVFVDGQMVTLPGARVPVSAVLRLRELSLIHI